MNKKVFTVKNGDNELTLAIKKPTAKIRIDARLVYNKAWKDSEAAGSILRRNLEELAEKHGVWNDESRRKVNEVSTEILSLERKLMGGAANFSSKEEAKDCAFKLRRLRREFLELNRAKDELYQYTAESHADRAQTQYMISQCCVDDNTGKLYWRNYEEFVEQSDSPVAQAATENYYLLNFEELEDIDASFYENQWLKKYHFVDDKFRPINKDGKLIDIDTGKLVDEEGYFVTEDGYRCDKDGNKIDKDGRYIVEYVEFS